jgi:glutamine synthetase
MADNGVDAVGRKGFVDQHDLLTKDQLEAGRDAAGRIEADGIRTVRIAWADQHGIPRGKFVSAHDFETGLANGFDFSGATLVMDTTNHLFAPIFTEGGGFDIPEFTGFPDVQLVPDPTTFQVLPWAPSTGWVLCDMYFGNGKPVPFDTRAIMRRQLEALGAAGFEYWAGLEVEFYIVRRETEVDRIDANATGWPPPTFPVSVSEQGYQYLSETRLAGVNDILTILRDAYEAIGLPIRTMEDEWGPGQMEFTFDPMTGLGSADAMVLFRTATKQICQANGYHATFMCRPNLPNFFSSGWHLHESLRGTKDRAPAFMNTGGDGEPLSQTGKQFLAGILEHAMPMTVFTTPTVTGYKRFRPYSFAPDRVNWAVENRGAMVRVQGGPNDPGTHLENRMGEPAANPYLYMGANVAAGLDGIARSLTPPPAEGADPYADTASTQLPRTLWQAVDALAEDTFFRGAFGDVFIDYMLMMKRSEVDRFLGEVTDWEMREYFEFF